MRSAHSFKTSALVFLTGSLLATSAMTAQSVQVYQETIEQVLPAKGHQSKVSLADSLVKLTQAGVIDRKKLEAIYADAGGAPEELKILLDEPSSRPILLTQANARLYVNLLWPLGLANHMESNSASPLNGPALMSYASTGGWTLGRQANGGAYFNKFPIVKLTAQQEAMVVRIAKNSFRPCCNNSTFFQDCNHGSAMLGLLTLGASQGLTEPDLYREALVFSSFWFPEHAAHTALYFKVAKGTDWTKVDAKTALSANYFSASGMQENVTRELSGRGLVPQQRGTSCSA